MAIINSSCAKTENIPSIKVNASSNAASKNIGNSNDESKIILYMKDHEASGLMCAEKTGGFNLVN